MNVGVVTTWFARGAAYVSQQYEAALQRQHSVHIYARGQETTSGDPAWTLPNVTFGARGLYPDPSSVDLRDFERWLVRKRIDFVVFNEQWWWEPVILCAERGIRTAAYLVEYRPADIPLYDLYDVLIAHTRQHFDTFPNHRNRHFIPWGTTLPVHAEPRKDPECAVFLHSAGMNPNRKGTDIVLRAFSNAIEAGLRRFRLVLHSQLPLAGVQWKDPDATGFLRKLGADDRVQIVERSFDRRTDLYAEGDICLYPARFDGMGLTVAEANARGLPIAVPDHPPWNEFVSHQNGSVLACARVYHTSRAAHPFVEVEAASLAADIWRWSEADIAQWKEQAAQFAREHFDWNRNAVELGSILERAPLLDKRSAIEAAKAFERSQRRTIRQRVSFSIPWAVRTLRALRP